MSNRLIAAPRPSYRLIPSQFPPIGLFDTVATAADLEAVMELVGWTNDRLVADRLNRLPRDEWVYNKPNASVVMASFLHVAPGGMRFNSGDLGAWYAAAEVRTAAAEVGHHLRREVAARNVPRMVRTYRCYTATLHGEYVDIRGRQAEMPDIYDSASYTASQTFGENLRAAGDAGVVFDSLRHRSGVNVVALRPRNIDEIMQTEHFEISVEAGDRHIQVRTLPISGASEADIRPVDDLP